MLKKICSIRLHSDTVQSTTRNAQTPAASLSSASITPVRSGFTHQTTVRQPMSSSTPMFSVARAARSAYRLWTSAAVLLSSIVFPSVGAPVKGSDVCPVNSLDVCPVNPLDICPVNPLDIGQPVGRQTFIGNHTSASFTNSSSFTSVEDLESNMFSSDLLPEASDDNLLPEVHDDEAQTSVQVLNVSSSQQLSQHPSPEIYVNSNGLISSHPTPDKALHQLRVSVERSIADAYGKVTQSSERLPLMQLPLPLRKFLIKIKDMPTELRTFQTFIRRIDITPKEIRFFNMEQLNGFSVLKRELFSVAAGLRGLSSSRVESSNRQGITNLARFMTNVLNKRRPHSFVPDFTEHEFYFVNRPLIYQVFSDLNIQHSKGSNPMETIRALGAPVGIQAERQYNLVRALAFGIDPVQAQFYFQANHYELIDKPKNQPLHIFQDFFAHAIANFPDGNELNGGLSHHLTGLMLPHTYKHGIPTGPRLKSLVDNIFESNPEIASYTGWKDLIVEALEKWVTDFGVTIRGADKPFKRYSYFMPKVGANPSDPVVEPVDHMDVIADWLLGLKEGQPSAKPSGSSTGTKQSRQNPKSKQPRRATNNKQPRRHN